MARNFSGAIAFLSKLYTKSSEEMRILIRIAVLQLEEKAKATKNPWDDILVTLLKLALFIPKDPEK